MELREWLIILGLALVTIIVVDGVRRLQRQRRVPRLDQVDTRPNGANRVDMDLDDEAKAAEINWELPNGGARVVRPAASEQVAPKPKLKRQEHPGASRVLSEWREKSRDAGSSPEPGSNSPAAATAPPQAAAPMAAAPEQAASTEQAAESRSPDEALRAEPPPAAEPRTSKPRAEQAASEVPPEPASREAGNISAQAETPPSEEPTRTEPTLSALDADEAPQATSEPLAADPDDHDEHHDAERYRLVDLEGMTDSFKERSTQVGASMQRFGSSMKQSLAARKEQRKKDKLEKARLKAEKQAREASRRKQAEAEKAAKLAAEREQEAARQAERREQQARDAQAISAQDQDDPLFAPSRLHHVDSRYAEPSFDEAAARVQRPVDDSAYESRPAAEREPQVASHPVVEKALRHDINVEHARDTLSHAEEVIVISVMSRDEEGFSGSALLDLMLACGLRYSSEMGIFNRFETEDSESELQFSMVNVVKPGTFPLDAMDEFRTPGVTLLMPLPGALDSAAAFEAMVETAMVIVRHLGGELKDENRSVMTAQTVEFARQRVQEFERRHRLHRYQAN
ncbi:cell division protein ZipA [Franzmannia pantelleriensis]|uniref:Cell division protein ZipA n=1 Tax=Franzmannia pantelleriensis TaxID=48727 RepID=A0A1G9Q733_9GAMM|nr:cell division protein ZipA [Halomonas pantelleriensis]SDM06864.1 cell division protein ZipA [Halomonas pantelleriensis]